MSGNDNSGGPWGGGGGGGPRRPWGQQPPPAPRGGGEDLEDMLRRLRERFFGGGGGGNTKKGPTGPGGRGVSWPLVAAIIVLGWLATGFYVVNEGEQAVITRLGRFDRITGPGAHWRLPPPMEGAMTFNVTGQRSDEIGCERTNNRCADPEEGLMLTGDRNIVDVHFRVLYNIANVRDFAFNVRDPVDADRNDDNQGAVRQVVESAMREVVGRRQLEQIITTDRGAVEEDVHRLAQQVLNDYQVGVRVLQVQLLTATVPPDVIAAFNDVIIANQDAETATNNANRDSSRLLNTAQAYKEQVVREATGETQRFLSVYNEYRLNPQVTRDRLYLETMERVYASNNLVILDSRGGAVPYLPLDMLRRNNAAPAAPPAQGAH